MALRYVRPLKYEDWVVLAKEFEKGPSQEQREAVRNAIENTKRLGIDKFPNLD